MTIVDPDCVKCEVVPSMKASLYHADPAINKSALWTYRSEGAAMYYHSFISGEAPKKKSAAMDLGSLTHAALLEPHKLSSDFGTWPADVLSVDGKATTKAAKEFAAANAGKTLLKADEWESARCMVASVQGAVGSWFRARPKLETSIFWRDEETDLRCKCRCDFLLVTPDLVLVADVKTCSDASPKAFRRSVENYGYWMQDSFYRQGASIAYGKPAKFVFIAVQSCFPFLCGVYELSTEDQEAADYHTAITMRELKDRIDRNDWRDHWVCGHNTITLSRFAFE